MQIKRKFGLGGTLAIAALVGCGGNSSPSGGGNGQFTTSVPSGTKLTSLTSTQAMQICTDFNSYLQNTFAPDECKLLAVEDAAILALSSSPAPSNTTIQSTCTQEYNLCLSGDAGVTTGTGTCTASSLSTEPATCTATVGDFTMCANQELGAYTTLAGQLPNCSSITASSAMSALTTIAAAADAGVTMSATCTTLSSQCSTTGFEGFAGAVNRARAARK